MKKNKILENISQDIIGLRRAQKLQEAAATVGFDWPHISFVLDKLKEEVAEFEEALENNRSHALEELGDILFVCANLARHLQSDAENVMEQVNRKFEQRFNGIEEKVTKSGKEWEAYTLDELEKFWIEVKGENCKG